tara:strand:- start:4291 stop:4641 length:351 start_codon:yes stop_codon:yes gene_type:complete
MPIYSFIHPDTEEEKEIVQKMNEPHVYIDENGIEWKRMWTSPNAQIDTDIDPFNSKDFVSKTANKKGTMGDMWDRSKELSMKRAEKNGGKDPVKEKYLKEYSKERKGRQLPSHLTD